MQQTMLFYTVTKKVYQDILAWWMSKGHFFGFPWVKAALWICPVYANAEYLLETWCVSAQGGISLLVFPTCQYIWQITATACASGTLAF